METGLYKHFKGAEYRVIAVAEHSETGEKLVVYLALYGERKLYVRPFDMFNEMVDDCNGGMVERFKFLAKV